MSKPNTGVLFKNDKKQSENHPDYNGSIDINGTEHFLSAWINTSKTGTKYMSLSIGKAKGQQDSKPQQSQQAAPPDFDDDKDIPF